MEDFNENGRLNLSIFDGPTQHWVSSGQYYSPFYHDNNNNASRGARKRLRRRLSFNNSDGMADCNYQGLTVDDKETIAVPKSNFKSEKTARWDDERINNSESGDIKSKCDETFSEGSSTSSADKDTDNSTEVELRLRVRQFDEENALLRDELVKAEDIVNKHQRKLRLLQEKFDQMKEKCDQFLKENDEQRELITVIETQEKRCQVALQRLDKERSSLIEKLQTDKETYNRNLEKLSKEKLDCTKQLTACKMKLEEKAIECDSLQKKINEMNELVASLEEHYEKTIRFLQDRSDDLTTANSELTERLMNLEFPTSLDREMCNTSTICLESLSGRMSAQKNQKINLQDSLYCELKASGFSVESTKNDMKIRELEKELDWYNNEIHEAGRQIYKIINVLKRKKDITSSWRADSPEDDFSYTDSSPIVMIFDKITELSREVSEAFKKPLTCDSTSQVSADAIKMSELQRELGIKAFEDNLSSPIKVPETLSINTEDVFLTLAQRTDKSCKSKPCETANYIDSKNNVIIQSTSSSISRDAEFVELAEDKSTVNKINESVTEINLRLPSEPISFNTTEEEEAAVEELPFSSSSPICYNVSSRVDVGELEMSTSQREPRRKISVFSRSFDIDTVYEVQDGGGISESHTLSEHHKIQSVNRLIDNQNKDKNVDENHDQAHGKNTENNFDSNTVMNNISYRQTDTKDLSDSSASSTPIKLNTWQEEDTPLDSKKNSNLAIPIVLAPARLNFSIAKSEMEVNNATGLLNNCENGELSSVAKLNEMCSDTPVNETVIRAMSSGEDSSDDSDTDSPAADEKFAHHQLNNNTNLSPRYADNNYATKNPYSSFRYNKSIKHEERSPKIKRSMSEGESLEFGGGDGCSSCNVNQSDEKKLNNVKKEVEITAFPSLTDVRLQESGIAHLSDSDDLEGKDLNEEDLERKYVAFSLGLCTDRVTLSRRRALSIHQRDQVEHNLATEIARMQQSIQASGEKFEKILRDKVEENRLQNRGIENAELAPLCFDSETIERIELACNQVEIIAQCAKRVSCTAETLGAVQQESRISRAIYLADRYLKILRNRCEKLMTDVAEKKKILAENNIVFDEDNGEGELSSAVRYRALSPTANRMMARRRASIATIFRPIGGVQEGTKDNVRQRNSVSGRVTIRRPSFSSESQRWETEKLNRTDSSSVGELREVFEQADTPRRTSREENNNLVRSQIIVCENESIERRMSSGNREEPIIETLPEEQEHELHEEESTFVRTRLSTSEASAHITNWRLMLWCTLISFMIGFYIKDAISSTSACATVPHFRWSFEEYLNRLVYVKNLRPRPI